MKTQVSGISHIIGNLMMEALSQWAMPVLALPWSAKRFLVLALEAGMCVLAVWLTFYLRLDTAKSSWMRLPMKSTTDPESAWAYAHLWRNTLNCY